MPVVVSLFSGAGGLDQGFRAAGYKIACCVELERWACDTLRRNHSETPIMGPPLHSGNIEDISATDICNFAGLQPKDVDVLIGGPPCQPFSQAATQRFLKGDERFKRQGFNDILKGHLLSHYVRLIIEFQPRAFVLENVPGLKDIDDGIQLSKILEELHAHDYHTSPVETLDAVDYGIPQRRERLIIWGSKTIDNPTLPQATHAKAGHIFLSPYKTATHALVGMSQSFFNHVTREHTASSIERYRKLDFGKRDKKGRVDRLDPTKPSKTVIAGGDSGGGRSHLHPFIARTLTVRESARLQTFDDEYIFEGTISRQFTQVGNAVPPLLAEHIARHIKWEEFAEKVTEPLHYGQYLHHDKDIEALIKQLLDESRAIKPEWVYYTHTITADEHSAKTLIAGSPSSKEEILPDIPLGQILPIPCKLVHGDSDVHPVLIRNIAQQLRLEQKNLIPVFVKYLGENKYQAILNTQILAAAQQAELDSIWCIVVNEQMHSQIKIESGQVVKIDILTASEQKLNDIFEYIKAKTPSFKNIKSNKVAKTIVEYRNEKKIDSLNFLVKQRCGIGKAKISILSNYLTITSPRTIKNIDEVEQPRETIKFGKSPTDENCKAIKTQLAYVGNK